MNAASIAFRSITCWRHTSESLANWPAKAGAAGSALATVLGAAGAGVGRFFTGAGSSGALIEDVLASFTDGAALAASFATGVGGSIVGLAAGFLTDELGDLFGVDGSGFGAQLFDHVTSSITSGALSQLVSADAQVAGVFGDFIAAGGENAFALLTSGLEAGNLVSIAEGLNIGGFVGGYLGRQIVEIENIGGAIGQSLGNAIGSIVGTAAAKAAGAPPSLVHTIYQKFGGGLWPRRNRHAFRRMRAIKGSCAGSGSLLSSKMNVCKPPHCNRPPLPTRQFVRDGFSACRTAKVARKKSHFLR
ncbi:MAG: hypothetical protein NW205_12555 [Hyphomicrobiaceae bacterium]|nr:hypothetical protein [Hyphomicrobiaceae bacterium]